MWHQHVILKKVLLVLYISGQEDSCIGSGSVNRGFKSPQFFCQSMQGLLEYTVIFQGEILMYGGYSDEGGGSVTILGFYSCPDQPI